MQIAVEKLVTDNLALVGYTVGKFMTNPLTKNNPLYDRDDLMQLGNLALFKAARSFDPSKGGSFSTYAVTAIRNEINIAFYRQSRKEDIYSFTQDKSLESFEPVMTRESAFEEADLKERVTELSGCLKGEAKKSAEKIMLFMGMGYSIKESADLSGVSERRAYKLIAKIRKNYKAS